MSTKSILFAGAFALCIALCACRKPANPEPTALPTDAVLPVTVTEAPSAIADAPQTPGPTDEPTLPTEEATAPATEEENLIAVPEPTGEPAAPTETGRPDSAPTVAPTNAPSPEPPAQSDEGSWTPVI